jgi:TPR repeat protein
MKSCRLAYILVFAWLHSLPAAADVRQDITRAKDAMQNADYAGALKTFKRLSEEGNGEATFYLSEMYGRALGVKQNTKESIKYLERAVQLGYTHALTRLAQLYEEGNGLPQDQNKAHELFKQAAARGDADAQWELAQPYLLKSGKDDLAVGIQLARKAAQQGNLEAAVTLASMYKSGKQVPRNYREAALWLEKACPSSIKARVELASMYHEGVGVPQDDRKALLVYTSYATSKAHQYWQKKISSAHCSRQDVQQGVDWMLGRMAAGRRNTIETYDLLNVR